MEIKKSDFKKFRIVNTIFYALPIDFFEKKEEEAKRRVQADIDRMVKAEEAEAEDLAAKKAIEEEEKAKEEKIAKLKAKLEELEE